MGRLLRPPDCIFHALLGFGFAVLVWVGHRRSPLDKRQVVQAHPNFIMNLGLFHGAWSVIDLSVDCAIGKFLNVSPEQMHLITTGMMSGPKLRLLHGLVGRSDHAQKAQIIGAINKLQNEAKRAALTHSYVYSNETTITFLERIPGEFRAREHTFTLTEFQEHNKALAKAMQDLWAALGYSDDDLQAVIDAARKYIKS